MKQTAPQTGETDKWIQTITTYGSSHKLKFLQEPVLWQKNQEGYWEFLKAWSEHI